MLNLIYLLNTLHFLNKRLHIILKKLNLMAKKKKIPKIGPAIITTSRLDEIRKRLRETYGLGNLNTNLFKIKPFKSTTESVKDIINGCKSQDVQLRNEALALLYGIIREPIHAFILRYYCGYEYPNDCWDIAGDIALKIATEDVIKSYRKKPGKKFRSWIAKLYLDINNFPKAVEFYEKAFNFDLHSLYALLWGIAALLEKK